MSDNVTSQQVQNQIASMPFQSLRSPYLPAAGDINTIAPNATALWNQSQPGIGAATGFAGSAAGPSAAAYNAAAGQAVNPISPDLQMPWNTLTGLAGGGGNAANFQSIYNQADPYNSSNNMDLQWMQRLIGQADALSAPEKNLQGLASNTTGALTSTQQQILDQNAERLGDRLASQYSGAGRYGSAGAGVGLARGIAETNNPLIAQFSQNAIQNALAANQAISAGTLGRWGLQGQLAGQYGQNLAQRAQTRAGAAQGMTAADQQRLAAASEAMNQYRQNQGQAWSALPSLFAGGVGAGATQAQLPWQNLQSYSSILGNAYSPYLSTFGTQPTNVGSTTTNTQPTPWTTYAGLGIAGAGALSKFI